jgi:secreted protein with Ig-like and vWFA domain
MMRTFFGLLLLAAVARPAGRITGMVADQTGMPIRGVKITATPEPPGPPRSTYTDGEGRYALELPGGRYTVTASAPRLEKVMQRGVLVEASKATDWSVVMEVLGGTEEVRVVEKAPLVSTSRVNVSESYNLDFVQGMPPGSREESWRYAPPVAQESYASIAETPFLSAADNPLSTFAIDVDTASYANVRRFITQGQLPPAGAVRTEELINYFPYRYPAPGPGQPFAASMEVAACPWNPEARLVRIGLKGREVPITDRPPANLVFLIDVSGSMSTEDKLPLVQRSLRLLVEELRPHDRVALVVYAGNSGVVLAPTPATARASILEAIDRLSAGGSTNGGQGIELAYRLARQAFLPAGNNRVILATDGDFNVGVTSEAALVQLIEREAKSNVFLTVLGVGTGNYKDATMEKLADHGNGNYAYLDSLSEARKVLVEQLAGTLLTIAKDVKIQVELNPAQVGAYRLIGYENRLLRKEDFNDDRKDGGEIGAGHTVTALYEILPPGAAAQKALAGVDALRYGAPAPRAHASSDLLTLKVRWKAPDGDRSVRREWALVDTRAAEGSSDFRFAAAVAAFGLVLRDSPYRGSADLDLVERLADVSFDPGGHRQGFRELVSRVRGLAGTAMQGVGRSPGALTIEEEGRWDAIVKVANGRVDGKVRGAPVSVSVERSSIAGHMAGEPVRIWMRGREAEGEIGGHDVGFTLIETPTGHLLRGKAVGHTVRLEESYGVLTWLPSCERPLVRLPRGTAAEQTYQGTCESGHRMRVTLPDQFGALEPLPRLVLLSLLLTDREEPTGAPRLFPAKAGR